MIPHDHPPAGLHDPDHFGERLAYVVGVGDVVHDGDGDDEVKAVVIKRQRGARRVHRADERRPGLEDLEHPRRGIDSDHLVSGAGEPLGEHPGPAADVEALAPRAVGDHERRPLLQVVLGDVRGNRLVIDGRDRVKV